MIFKEEILITKLSLAKYEQYILYYNIKYQKNIVWKCILLSTIIFGLFDNNILFDKSSSK